VALKIIKPGMDTRQVIARFEAERQALALMDHPGIAKVLDAGSTSAGRPFFVMELVSGVKITEYCDQNHLSIQDRLELFIQVGHAIQHAHQKGIVHRDIKPSNILVTEQDGKPVPKVIDFGVAKAMGQQLTEKTLHSGMFQLLGTPAYMSPEQTEPGAVDIDTRSDLYSLGALLYELLTGFPPFDREAMRAAALEEIRRMIRETEPLKPSTRLSKLVRDQLAAVAARHNVDPTKLRRLIRGDLDWIVMKALAKERNRRYEAAIALTQDLERHLRNEPVSAAAPSLTYRSSKFIRRHWIALSVTCVVLVILGAGIGIGTWLLTRATTAERARIKLGSFMKESIERRVAAALAFEKHLDRGLAMREFRENMPEELQEALISLLKSSDASIRRRAAEALWLPLSVAQAEKLADHLDNPDPVVREFCSGALWQIRSPGVDRAWEKAISSPYEHLAQRACLEVGKRGTPPGTEVLFDALTNRPWCVRFVACTALINQWKADDRVVATLEALGRDPEARRTQKIWHG
jgi:hypothetical protein